MLLLNNISNKTNMSGNTHVAIGVASSLILIRPKDIKEILTVVAVSAFSSLLVDIDIKSSKVNKILKKVLTLMIFSIIVSIAVDYIYNLGYFKNTINKINTNQWNLIIISIISIILFYLIIKNGGHRGFTHSVLAVVLLGIFGYIWLPSIVNYSLIIGYSMHIIFDITNKKGLQVFYPLSGRYCFHWFKSDGLVNNILFIAGMILSIITIVLLLFGILK